MLVFSAFFILRLLLDLTNLYTFPIKTYINTRPDIFVLFFNFKLRDLKLKIA